MGSIPAEFGGTGRLGQATRRDLLRWSGGLGLLLATAACAPQDSGDAGTPKSGGVLTIAQMGPATIKAPVNQAIPNQSWRRGVYDTLVDYDPVTRKVVAALATKFELSPDAKQLTLELRDGVKWHTGRAFDAADVEFNLEKAVAANPVFNMGWMFKTLQKVNKQGNTVTLEFGEPVPNIYDALSLMILVDRESYAAFLDGTKHVGTGPYMWDTFNPNTGMTMKRNAAYWGGQPFFDSVEVRFFARSEAMVAAVRSGQVQVGLNLLPLDRQTVASESSLSVLPYSTFGAGLYAGLNTKVELLKSKEVRQAIHYAIDRQRINTELYLGQGKVNALPWSPVSSAYSDANANAYARDLEKAKSLLAAAGAVGKEIVVEVNAQTEKVGEIVAFNLNEIGLKAKISKLDPATGVEKFKNRSYAGVWLGFHGWNTLSPVNVVYGAVPYRTWDNLFGFNSDTFVKLAAAVEKAGPAESGPATAALSQFLLDEAFCLDIVQTSNNAVTQKAVQGWSYNIWDDVLLAQVTRS